MVDVAVPPDVWDATVLSIEPDLDTVSIDTDEVLEDGTTLGAVTATAQVHYEGFVHKSDQYTNESAWTITDLDWSEHYVAVEGTLSAQVEFSLIVSGEELESLTLTQVHQE